MDPWASVVRIPTEQMPVLIGIPSTMCHGWYGGEVVGLHASSSLVSLDDRQSLPCPTEAVARGPPPPGPPLPQGALSSLPLGGCRGLARAGMECITWIRKRGWREGKPMSPPLPFPSVSVRVFLHALRLAPLLGTHLLVQSGVLCLSADFPPWPWSGVNDEQARRDAASFSTSRRRVVGVAAVILLWLLLGGCDTCLSRDWASNALA